MAWMLAGTLVGVALAVYMLATKARRSREMAVGSLGDWIRNPDAFYAQGAQTLADVEDSPPADITDRQIQAYVHDLQNDKKARRAANVLAKVGERAIHSLIDALSDPAYRKPPSREEPRYMYRLPVERVIDVLEQINSAKAIPALTPLVADPDPEIRKGAALALGSIAQPDCAEPVRLALTAHDEKLCSYVMIGLLRAIEAGRARPEYLIGLFDSLKPLLTGVDNPGGAVRALLAADRERAMTAILSDEVLAPGNPGLSQVLRALAETDVQVPAVRLWRLEKELAPMSAEHPHDSSYGHVLILLAAGRSEGTEERLAAAIQSPAVLVQQLAATALARLRGAKDPIEFVFTLENERGWSSMTTTQQQFYAVHWLECEVNNGGFSQYLFNSAGDQWPEALQGLEAMEAFVTAGLLRAAVGVFGPKGPSRDRERRQRQLAELIDEHEEKLNELDHRFYEDQDHLHVRLMKYAAENADEFQ